MSPGFRIFILILCAFGAISIYRFRSPELSHWLRQSPSRMPDRVDEPLVSPVDRILGPEAALATLWLRGAAPPAGPAGPGVEPEPAAAPLSPEELMLGADLPVVEDEGPGPEEATAPAGAAAGDGAAETPPEPRPEPEAPAEPPGVVAFAEVAYEVKEGDNLWRIAARFLGAGSRYQEIREQNREVFKDRGSDIVPAGTVLKIRVPAPRDGLKVPGPQVDTSVEQNPAPAPRPAVDDRTPVYHTVRRSESLQRIARQYFPEDVDGWRTIFAANRDRLPSPDLVREGQVLVIPAR
jgi:nucleoid-associated protein YgaU